MPIDPSVALNVKPAQFNVQDPLERFGKIMALKNMQMQGDITERSIADNERFRELFARNPNPTPAEVMAISPDKGIAYQKSLLDRKQAEATIEQHLAGADKSRHDVLRDQLERTGALLTAAKDQPSWDMVRRAIIIQNPKAAPTLPEQYDPAFVQTQIAQGQTLTQHLETQNRAAALTETGRHNLTTEGAQAATLTETKRHHAALEGDPQTVEQTAQAIAKGTLAPLSGFALARPMAQNIMARVVQINPDYDPTQFQTRQKAEKDFATGKQGNSVRSFNVALSHLDTLGQLSSALDNGNMQLVNKIANAYSSQTGGAAPSNFEAAKKIVGDEIVKAIIGSGGGVSDREEAAKTISAVSSPAQLKGVINTYKELMKGQIKGLREQYKATTGKEDFDTKYLSEAGRQVGNAVTAPTQADIDAELRRRGLIK